MGSTSTYQMGILHSRAYRAFRSFVAKELKQHQLTMTQWSLLGVIYEAGKDGLKASDLAKLLDVEISLITNMLNDLESQKMIIRKPHSSDKRVKRITLTTPMVWRVRRIEKHLQKQLRNWLDGLSGTEFSRYVETLRKIAGSA